MHGCPWHPWLPKPEDADKMVQYLPLTSTHPGHTPCFSFITFLVASSLKTFFNYIFEISFCVKECGKGLRVGTGVTQGQLHH